MKNPILTAKELVIGYDRPLICNISFQVEAGEYIAVIGPNGAGKSTLLKTILGLIPKLKGEIQRHGLTERGSISYVPQRESFDELFPISARQVVEQGRYPLVGLGRWLKKKDRQLAQDALEQMGVASFANAPFRSLSGGQKQRVLIARALASKPKLLVLDEPTANMDVQGECEVIATLQRLRHESEMTILVVSHFLSSLRGQVERVLICDSTNGTFKESTPEIALDPDAVQRLFAPHCKGKGANRGLCLEESVKKAS